MKRRIVTYTLVILSFVFAAIAFSSCSLPSVREECKHDWTEASCKAPKTCTLCGKIDGKALPHIGGTATCDTKAKCKNCKKSYGKLLEHTWEEATCLAPKTCTECGETEGEALSHAGGTSTCEQGAICDTCGTEYGNLLGHTWVEATCQTPKTCSVCQKTEGEIGGHVGTEPSCIAKSICDICGEEFGEIDPSLHASEPRWYKQLDTHYEAYACCGVIVSAQENHVKEDGVCKICGYDPQIKMSTVTVGKGIKQVSFVIEVIDNPGIIGLELSLSYDESVLTMVNATSGAALESFSFTSPDNLSASGKFLWDNIELSANDIKDGELLVLTFDIAEEALEGYYNILIKVKAYDSNFSLLSFKLTNGVLNIDKDIAVEEEDETMKDNSDLKDKIDDILKDENKTDDEKKEEIKNEIDKNENMSDENKEDLKDKVDEIVGDQNKTDEEKSEDLKDAVDDATKEEIKGEIDNSQNQNSDSNCNSNNNLQNGDNKQPPDEEEENLDYLEGLDEETRLKIEAYLAALKGQN